MPKVGGKKYPYTKKGKQAARAERVRMLQKKRKKGGGEKKYGY